MKKMIDVAEVFKYEPTIISLLLDFYRSTIPKVMGDEELRLSVDYFVGCMLNKRAYVFVDEEGSKVVAAIGFLVSNGMWAKKPICSHTFFYAKKNGIFLLKYAEKQLRAMGFRYIKMVAFCSSPCKLGIVYEKLGYKQLETHFLKRLK